MFAVSPGHLIGHLIRGGVRLEEVHSRAGSSYSERSRNDESREEPARIKGRVQRCYAELMVRKGHVANRNVRISLQRNTAFIDEGGAEDGSQPDQCGGVIAGVVNRIARQLACVSEAQITRIVSMKYRVESVCFGAGR